MAFKKKPFFIIVWSLSLLVPPATSFSSSFPSSSLSSLLVFLFFSLSPFKARSYSRSSLAWNHYRQESANLPFPNVPPAPQCSDHRWVPPGLPHPILHGAQPSPPPSDLPQRLRLAARLGKGRGAEGVEPWSSCMIPGAEDPFLKWSP